MWQQHVVTAKYNSLRLGNPVTFETISSEKISIPESRLVWCSKQAGTLRICYNRLVVTSGTAGLKIVNRTGKFVKMVQPSTGVELLVNPRLNKLFRNSKVAERNK